MTYEIIRDLFAAWHYQELMQRRFTPWREVIINLRCIV